LALYSFEAGDRLVTKATEAYDAYGRAMGSPGALLAESPGEPARRLRQRKSSETRDAPDALICWIATESLILNGGTLTASRHRVDAAAVQFRRRTNDRRQIPSIQPVGCR